MQMQMGILIFFSPGPRKDTQMRRRDPGYYCAPPLPQISKQR